jgi:glycogen debranching enzyme
MGKQRAGGSATRSRSAKRRDRSRDSGHPQAKKSRSALVRTISDALVIKSQDIFFLCERDGRVPLQGKHGLGLYYHDCRYLNGYELKLGGADLSSLVATAGAGSRADLELTNPDLRLDDGRRMPKEDLAVLWERVTDPKRLALHDLLTFTNYGVETFTFPVALTFASAFEDIFIVRGMEAKSRGRLQEPRWDDGRLVLAYHGSDGVWRCLTILFDPPPRSTDGTTAHFRFEVPSHHETQLSVSLVMTESRSREEPLPALTSGDFQRASEVLHGGTQEWLGRQTECESSDPVLDRVLKRSLLDLHTLRSRLNGHEYFAAGVPWYVTLFGRDSIISALESLAFQPDIAADTLRLLAHYQGAKVDHWRDEEPGKIMHELRVGELAHDNDIPQTPYYGSVDSTPLFLILLGYEAAWSGSLRLFHDLRDNIERALRWVAEYGDADGDGYVEYASKSGKGLSNQGWKDSGDAISNTDGSLAKPPIALCEVQGYVYLAKTLLADLFRRAGEADRADLLMQEAKELRERFNRDFWLEDKGIYAVCLQGRDQRPAETVTSNAGQVLWSGIADDDKARRVAPRLMQHDMLNGWGIRTLSEKEKRYNPIGYHLGTVWPHDNALIATGFRRYSLDEPARDVWAGIVAAALQFPIYRLPEVFSGFRRRAFGQPVHYPVACHPQAWAAGSVPYLLTSLLGLKPEGFDKRLRVVRPVLPQRLEHVTLRGLRVGTAKVDLLFATGSEGKVGVEVLHSDGEVDVAVEG